MTQIVSSKPELKDTPNGDYKGVWGGYVVLVTINDIQYRMKTRDGIRSPGEDAIVHIENGAATVAPC